jgi:hypothetical protein
VAFPAINSSICLQVAEYLRSQPYTRTIATVMTAAFSGQFGKSQPKGYTKNRIDRPQLSA